MGGEEHPDGHRVVDNAHLVMTGDGNGNDDGDNDGDGVVGDADQVGGEGQVHRLGVGGQVQVEQQQAKEDQVEVEVEALQKKLSSAKPFDFLQMKVPQVQILRRPRRREVCERRGKA